MSVGLWMITQVVLETRPSTPLFCACCFSLPKTSTPNFSSYFGTRTFEWHVTLIHHIIFRTHSLMLLILKWYLHIVLCATSQLICEAAWLVSLFKVQGSRLNSLWVRAIEIRYLASRLVSSGCTWSHQKNGWMNISPFLDTTHVSNKVLLDPWAIWGRRC